MPGQVVTVLGEITPRITGLVSARHTAGPAPQKPLPFLVPGRSGTAGTVSQRAPAYVLCQCRVGTAGAAGRAGGTVVFSPCRRRHEVRALAEV